MKKCDENLFSPFLVDHDFKFKIIIFFFYQNLTGGEIDDDVSSVHSVLTEEERFRLREVIMTDERIQTILKETHTTERMMMLKDYR